MITKRKDAYTLNRIEQGSSSNNMSDQWYDPRLNALFIEEAHLVGIDMPRRQLIRWLMNGDSRLSTISVVVHLLRNMIKQFSEAKKEQSPEGVDAMTQNFISNALPTSEYGSWVMITTRKGDVASSSCIGPSNHIYNLQPLHPENAWSLFCRQAFQSNEENSCPQELEKLSRSSVKKCQGLPLAIVTLGSLLSVKGKTYVEWEMIHRSLGSELESDDNLRSMTKILLLSFNDLPYYLKSCFLYLSIFPEDYAIKRMKLIRLWIAEGFVERNEGRSMEEVAEGYLNVLITRNVALVTERKSYGKVITCQIHDLVRETIIPKFREEHFFASSVEENMNRIRHLSICNDGENFPKFDTFTRLHSVHFWGGWAIQNSCNHIVC
ncbi:disease resistance protein RPM1-like [Magnolia sinica]|uniref:disease resistance protein RPM1-like n=1 Tax=Magnolia sinica TaxID=86752 RepID=UPI0026598485|nr:disease resistance protein RPM1-like [Magnolia sinica]